MKQLGQSYVNAVNRLRSRVGPLFQGRFKARHVDDEAYLLHLSRYIHLNPVAAGIVSRPEEWEFSSYRDYVAGRNGRLPSTSTVLELANGVEFYRQFVESNPRNGDERIEPFIFVE